MFKRFAVIALLAVASASAIAVPKPSEVKAAVSSGNYVKAESLLLEVMKEKPSARAHYDLGQVYTFQGKHSLALNEYRQAQALDPTLKFASTASEFTKKLETAQTMVAPPPVAQAPKVAPPAVAYSVPAVQTAYVATAAPPKQDDSSILPLIFAFLIIGAVGGGAFYVVSRKREKAEVEDKLTSERREKNSTLLGMSKQLDDSVLIAKTALYSDAQKRQILDRIVTLQTQTRSMLAELKDGKEVSSMRISVLESHVSSVVDQASNGIHTPPPAPIPPAMAFTSAPKPAIDPRPIPGVTTTTGPTETIPPHPIPGVTTERVVHHYHAPAPAPTVVNNNDGLLTGMMIGSMMNNHHTTERVVERVVERDSYEDSTPVYRSPAPSPTFDVGSSNDDYSSSAPSVDSNSRDDDSY